MLSFLKGGKRKRRKSRRKSRRRHRRGGMSTDNAEFKAKMDKVATQANKTIVDANKAMAAASKAKMDAMNTAREVRLGKKIPSICKNPFMKDSAKCKKAAEKVEEGAKVLKGTSQSIKERANKLKASGLSQLGGKKRRRRSRSRRRKSRKSRRRRSRSRSRSRRRRGGSSCSKRRRRSRRRSRRRRRR